MFTALIEYGNEWNLGKRRNWAKLFGKAKIKFQSAAYATNNCNNDGFMAGL
jgi:hypothetical protein